MTARDQNPMILALRTARADIDMEQIRWVQAGFMRWWKSGGTVPMERCFRLPSTPGQMARVRRNAWIVRASRVLAMTPQAVPGDATNQPSDTRTARSLAHELDVFVQRGGWPQWRHLPRPPADASQLRRCLFFIAKNGDGKALSAKQIERIMGRFQGVDLSWLELED